MDRPEDDDVTKTRANNEAYLARKTHRKSRLGCVECKRRRVKCDEAKPACTNCRRRGAPCDYSTATSTRYRTPPRPDEHMTTPTAYYANGTDPIATASSSSYGGTPALAAAPLPHASYYAPVAFAFDLFDMELWHHWLTVACHSFDDNLGAVMSRTDTLKCVFTHEYVAQLLLALSALHLGRTYSDRAADCIRRSSALQSASMNGMMTALANPDRNATALWTAAVMLAFCSFGRGPQPGQYLIYSDNREPEWLGLLQDVKSIMGQPPDALAGIVSSPLQQGITKEPLNPEEHVPGVGKAIQNLRNSIDALRAEDGTCDKYIRPLDDLRVCFSEVFEKRSDSSEVKLVPQHIFAWLYRLDADYIVSVQSKRPMALVVLAHYLVLMSQNKQAWYLDGWVSHIMEAIQQQLHPAYLQWLQWPLSASGGCPSDSAPAESNGSVSK